MNNEKVSIEDGFALVVNLYRELQEENKKLNEQIESHREFMNNLHTKLELENNLKMCNYIYIELSKEFKK